MINARKALAEEIAAKTDVEQGVKCEMSTLYLIRGVPGSGKTTLANMLGIPDHYEADMYFQSGFDASKLQDAHKWCMNKTRIALEAGHDVVVSNTFVHKWELIPYHELAAKNGATVVEIIVTGNFSSVHNVPSFTRRKMGMEFEYPDLLHRKHYYPIATLRSALKKIVYMIAYRGTMPVDNLIREIMAECLGVIK